MASLETKVYRLRGIPTHLDRMGVAQLIQPFLPDGKLEDIDVKSLALSCELWVRNPTKIATLTLRKLPEAVSIAPSAGEWELRVLALPMPLILDVMFYGLTPLNEVAESQHQSDCIVISGLASHPMGSWQPRGSDKSFMWIRDSLPKLVPEVRFILYGYDTKLVGSKSFQNVADLANNLINELKAGGWSSPSSKHLTFMAHSLGGVVLKHCLLMLAGSGASYELMLQKTKGAIFFGVPSEGMSIDDIHSMLGDQPNKSALIAEISGESSILPNLEKGVSGISQARGIKLCWAYETQTTPTVELVNGTYRRSGPDTILVSRESATGNRFNPDPSTTIQIDASHSNMVKFSSGNHTIGLIANKLQEILGNEQRDLAQDSEFLAVPQTPAMPPITTTLINSNSIDDPSKDLDFWDMDTIIRSIRAPERDERLEQIDKKAGCSFEWAFEDPSIGLSNWLQKGSGLYWISGRPASGKSTFMKFLYNDKRTKQLLQGWYSKVQRIEANFFFHYRGSHIQKSFEGLLRSILSQILEQAPNFFPIIHSKVQLRYQQHIKAQSLGSLYLDLQAFLESNGMKFDSDIRNKMLHILNCEAPKKLFRRIVVQPLLVDYYRTDWKQIEQALLPLREKLLDTLEKAENPEKDPLSTLPLSYTQDWDQKKKERFASLLIEWLKAVDLRKIMHSLKSSSSYRSRTVPATVAATNEKPTMAEVNEKFMQDVENIIHRFHRREEIQQSLEKALFQIINQQSSELDLCVLIDALDEYDGPPEFIAQFLKDIAEPRDSRTRVKILFSSRPWDTFMDTFRHCPGLRIHEHTENDIRELCTHIIETECPGSQELLQLVDEVVKRAKGVFLWVKLVLHDLAKIAVSASLGGDIDTLSSKLQTALKSLPDDLIDYYTTIVERTPLSFRRQAFCLLEIVAKGDEIYLTDVPEIIRCLDFSKFSQRDQIIENLDRPTLQQLATSLRACTGGLIEISWTPPHPKLQLLHQSTVEFVQLPKFKNTILGSGAHAMNDNGHTLLLKLLILKSPKTKPMTTKQVEFLRHARYAEKSTGKSLYWFFSTGSAPSYHKQFTHYCEQPGDPIEFQCPIKMAFGGYLRLFIDDLLKAEPWILSQKTNKCCIKTIFHAVLQGRVTPEEAIHMIDILAAHNFLFENHVDCLADYLMVLRLKDSRSVSLDELSIHILAKIRDSDVSVHMPLAGHQARNGPQTQDTASFIHLSSYATTKFLIRKKTNPNVKNSHGHTPMDCYTMGLYGCDRYEMAQLLRLMILVAENGGLLNVCTKINWERMMRRFQESELDVSLFDRLGFPKWINTSATLYLGGLL
ncbi:hypothetical protein V8C35DRAFT_323523 [Trichoderma chlorosporum]